jgi:hypothetical protein
MFTGVSEPSAASTSGWASAFSGNLPAGFWF